MINALTITKGIINNKMIDNVPFKIDIVQPKGKNNVRTLIRMVPIGITVHNTANKTAGDEAHAIWLQNVEFIDKQYVSVHFFVDDDSITQTVPINEVCYHAGDGKGLGNYRTIGIEICENGNILKAEENAKKLIASLIKTYPALNLYKHQDWSGKYCPRVILARNGWNKFKADVNDLVKPKPIITVIKKALPVKKAVDKNATSITINKVVYGYRSASDALKDKNRVKTVPKGKYPVMIKHKTGAWNIGKGYLYWINPNKL